MDQVEAAVLKIHTELMGSKAIDRESSRDLEVKGSNGIDSLGIVSMILGIEEELDVDLDDCLAHIRKCRTIGDIIDVVSAEVMNQNKEGA